MYIHTNNKVERGVWTMKVYTHYKQFLEADTDH